MSPMTILIGSVSGTGRRIPIMRPIPHLQARSRGVTRAAVVREVWPGVMPELRIERFKKWQAGKAYADNTQIGREITRVIAKLLT